MENIATQSRRRFLTLLSGLAASQGLTSCAWLQDLPIAIAAHVWLGYEPMFLAEREGWLDPRHVRLLETANASESIQALQTQRVDGAALTLDETLKARALGLPLSVVMVFNISAGADMLLVREGISELAGLRGVRLGFEQTSVGELLLAVILRRAGLSPQSLNLYPLAVDRHLQAWQDNQLDAVITYEPVASKILRQGAVKLFDTRQTPNTIVDVLAIRREALDRAHGFACRHLIEEHFHALDRLRRNPQDTAYRIAQHLRLPAAEVTAAYKGLLLPNADNNYRLLAGDTPELLKNAADLSETMYDSGLLPRPDDLQALINADFLPLDF